MIPSLSGKMILRASIPVLLARFGCAFGSLCALFGCAAYGQTSQSQNITPKNRPSFCKDGSFQEGKLLSGVSSIIAHGDLTDIPFLEKTLGTKLSKKPAKTYNGEPDPGRIFFHTDKILESSVYVDVSLSRSQTSPRKGEFLDYVLIYDQHAARENTTFIEDCIDVPPRTFSYYFGGDFVPLHNSDNPLPYTTFYRQEKFRGRNGTMLELSVSTDFMRPDNPVTSVGIYQVPQHSDSGG